MLPGRDVPSTRPPVSSLTQAGRESVRGEETRDPLELGWGVIPDRGPRPLQGPQMMHIGVRSCKGKATAISMFWHSGYNK